MRSGSMKTPKGLPALPERLAWGHWLRMLAQLQESAGSNLRETGNDRGQPDAYGLLVRSYSEATRHYHTTQHLAECLELFDQVRSHAEHPAEVEVALWCHDAIYVRSSRLRQT